MYCVTLSAWSVCKSLRIAEYWRVRRGVEAVVEGFMVGSFGAEDPGLGGRRAADAPSEVDQPVDELGRVGIGRFEVAEHPFGEYAEFFLGVFAIEKLCVRIDAATEGVPRGDSFALLGAGAGGFLCVFSIRL